MDVVIYESSSSGGCYKYSHYLLEHYRNSGNFGKADLLLPKGCDAESGLKILLKDYSGHKKYFPRFYFMTRNLINPLILFFYLLRKRKSFVLLNDFEQYSFFIWVPLFYMIKWKHIFGVFLHDPDRDGYMPTLWLSRLSMKWITRLMDYILFHEYLPSKPYYKYPEKLVSVPHGVYESKAPDPNMMAELKQLCGNEETVTMLGNIRPNKNYEFAIRTLVEIKDVNLMIAGSPANSRVDIQKLKNLSRSLGVEQRVKWIERYFSDEELSAIISYSSIMLLIYSEEFVSHSGVLNLIAPFKKKIIITDHPSGLNSLVKRFSLGKIVKDNDVGDLAAKIRELLSEDKVPIGWNEYIDYSSWMKQVELVSEKIIKN